MAKKLSIRDIAAELNISKTTVSFILNGKAREKRISEELEQKVLKYAALRDYKPNQLAKSLSTGKSMIIGLIVEKISDYFFAQIAYHLEELAYRNGYRIIYCSTDNDPEKARELIRLFRDRNVDGYIITPPAGIEQDIQALLDDQLPLVLFDRYFQGIDTSYVVLDNHEASYHAVSYLAGGGFRQIAFIELDSDQSQMHDRRAGYLHALAERNLEPLILKVPFANDAADTVALMIRFLQDNPGVEAIFFATNYLAFSGVKAINELKLKVPDDIALVAFDDHEAFDIYSPTVTAVAQPIHELAAAAIQVLLGQLDHQSPARSPQQVVVDARLIVRESTGVIPAVHL